MRLRVRALQAVLAITVASAAAVLWPKTAQAQAGDHPIRMLVGFPPGQATDLMPASNTDLMPASNTDLMPASNTDLMPASNTDLMPASN